MSWKISIIIPAYNTEKYLMRCISSIQNQTYLDLEIILIDDGSSDNTGRICCENIAVDSRVIQIHMNQSGVSSARNTGLQVATGDFLLFVDSDDWIDLNALEVFIAEFKKMPKLDLLLFAYVKEFKENSYPKHTFDTELHITSADKFKSIIYRRLFGLTNDELNYPERLEYLTTCWGKVYRLESIKNCRFIDIEQIGSCEDGLFNIDALDSCQSAVYLDKTLYHYRYTVGSLTLKYRAKLREQWQSLFEIMQKKINNTNLPADFQEALNNRIALSVLGIGMNEMDNPEGSFFQFVGYLNRYICSSEYRGAIKSMKLKKLPLPWKVLMMCCKCRFGLGIALNLKAIRIIKSRL